MIYAYVMSKCIISFSRQESHKLKAKVNATLPVDPALRGLESMAAWEAQPGRPGEDVGLHKSYV